LATLSRLMFSPTDIFLSPRLLIFVFVYDIIVLEFVATATLYHTTAPKHRWKLSLLLLVPTEQMEHRAELKGYIKAKEKIKAEPKNRKEKKT
jgi:hypothetical protein